MGNVDFILEHLKKEIGHANKELKKDHIGHVVEVFDGIAKISGLSDVAASEMLEFPNQIFGVALNLEEDIVGAIILGEYAQLHVGDVVKKTGKILEIPVGKAYLGRVVSPLGQPVDGAGHIKNDGFNPLEKIAPGVITRKSVNVPLQTGIKAIDAMIPIGRGQRELIIGDRQTGKTAIALDTIINQKGKDCICVYVAIGQKNSKVAKIVSKLQETGAMDYSIVVTTSASDSAALSYLAPFAGCALAEYFMAQGKDTLVIYDDLSKHANAYRQIALLLRRPPGREAYPGDIFYLHSRLLERAARLGEKYGGGSLTALPIIETQSGDVAAYIPTNVISITDGQIYLENDLFYKGVRPAINVGISVSRVGSSAQIKAMKKVSGRLKLDLAQYRELEAFAQFSTELDPETKRIIERGRRMTELLKQDQYMPQDVVMQIVSIFAGVNGLLDDVKLTDIRPFDEGLRAYVSHHGSKLVEKVRTKKEMTDEDNAELTQLISEYKQTKQEMLVSYGTK